MRRSSSPKSVGTRGKICAERDHPLTSLVTATRAASATRWRGVQRCVVVGECGCGNSKIAVPSIAPRGTPGIRSVVVAAVGDLLDQANVALSPWNALHLLSHLLALIHRRAKESPHPSLRRRGCVELLGCFRR